MASTSLDSFSSKDFGYAQAQHLLNRAGFGGTPKQITSLQQMGMTKAVDFLVDYQQIDVSALPKGEADGDIMRPPTADEKRLAKEAKTNEDQDLRDKLRAEQLRRMGLDRDQMGAIERWWLARMIATPCPLEEKLTLLWHGHFASNHRTIHDSYLMFTQNEMFRRNAAGNFGTLAHDIIRDPAMIRFLNNDSNLKAHPNENLGRELMELFTLGVGHYTEKDIKEGARALTGYSVDHHEFRFRAFIHDDGPKTILGRTGTFNGEDFVDILLSQAQCPRWVAFKLYKHFLGDVDDKSDPYVLAVIDELAKVVTHNSYELRPTLKTLFTSQCFYDPAVIGNQIKSPAQLVVGSARVLGAPVQNVGLLADAMSMMGQHLFDPPSVAGWYGGRSWINTSTLFVRQNLSAYLISGKLPFNDGWSPEKVQYDPTFLVADLPSKTPEAVADHLMATFLGCQASPARREELVKFLKDRNGAPKDVLIAALLLITAMPEYQLC